MAEETLGKFARDASAELSANSWELLVRRARGASNLSDAVRNLPHRASRLLDHLKSRGASVLMATPPWPQHQRDTAVARGPHKSAYDDREFVFAEILDFRAQGYWTVLPYEQVRDWADLRRSPLGVVPQRDRRPRLTVDYSFSAVNDETIQLAPKEAMQFGRALERVLIKIVTSNDRYGPVHMAKIDIADGFSGCGSASVIFPSWGSFSRPHPVNQHLLPFRWPYRWGGWSPHPTSQF